MHSICILQTVLTARYWRHISPPITMMESTTRAAHGGEGGQANSLARLGQITTTIPTSTRDSGHVRVHHTRSKWHHTRVDMRGS